jgi:hypothetical protein
LRNWRGEIFRLKFFSALPMATLSKDMADGSHKEPDGKSADARDQNPPHDTDVVLTNLPAGE